MRTIAFALVLAATPSLALADSSPRATAEAGFAAYQKHDLATAEKLTRDAIARAGGDDTTRGAALYNLGLILEAKGDGAGAITAYRDSVTARPNATVRDHLRTLDRASAEAVDLLQPQAMKGAFPTLDAYKGGVGPNRAFAPVGSILDVRIVTLPDDAGVDPGARGLAVKVGAGWYVGVLGEFEDLKHCTIEKLSFDSAVPRAISGATVVQLNYTVAGDCEHREDDWKWNEQSFALVGIGPSGQPMLTPSIELAVLEITGGSQKTLDIVRTATWGTDGMLTVAGTRGQGASRDQIAALQGPVLGKHTFVFK